MFQDIIEGQSPDPTTTASPTPQPNIAKQSRRLKPTGLPWLDEIHSSVYGEKALWVAVITQAMMDALSRSRHSEARYHKDEALRWLSENSKDFIEVCQNAGMDPDYVRRKAKKALLTCVEWRAAPGKGKRYHERKAFYERIKQEKIKARERPPANKKSPEDSCQVITGPWR